MQLVLYIRTLFPLHAEFTFLSLSLLKSSCSLIENSFKLVFFDYEETRRIYSEKSNAAWLLEIAYMECIASTS